MGHLSRLLPLLLACVITTTQAIEHYDCLHGFTGEIESSTGPGYVATNDTRQCAAPWCLKVIVQDGKDPDGFSHRGVFSRCAYTGSDRALCMDVHENGGGCTQVTAFQNLKGNFSLCCCRENRCNSFSEEDLLPLPTPEAAKVSKQRRGSETENGIDNKSPLWLIYPLYALAFLPLRGF